MEFWLFKEKYHRPLTWEYTNRYVARLHPMALATTKTLSFGESRLRSLPDHIMPTFSDTCCAATTLCVRYGENYFATIFLTQKTPSVMFLFGLLCCFFCLQLLTLLLDIVCLLFWKREGEVMDLAFFLRSLVFFARRNLRLFRSLFTFENHVRPSESQLVMVLNFQWFLQSMDLCQFYFHWKENMLKKYSE